MHTMPMIRYHTAWREDFWDLLCGLGLTVAAFELESLTGAALGSLLIAFLLSITTGFTGLGVDVSVMMLETSYRSQNDAVSIVIVESVTSRG